MYKLRGRSFWEIPFRGNMSWSWRKLLQTRPLVRRFFWHKIGNGKLTFAWHDNWCVNSPLSEKVTARQVSSMGFRMDAKVSDLVSRGEGRWPSAWAEYFLNTPFPCTFDDKDDVVVWKDRNGNEKQFSVGGVWHDIRLRGVGVDWFNIVWFSHSIPRHAFLLWLIFKRKLKTQDLLRQWDITGTDPSMLICPLCKVQPDSHDHLFFECSFSSQVWSKVKVKVNLNLVSSSWSSILNGILPNAKKRSMQGIAAKLVLAASAYIIWQERNARLFQRNSRTYEQLVNVILSTVRMKLLSFKYKETRRWEEFRALWELPSFACMGRKT